MTPAVSHADKHVHKCSEDGCLVCASWRDERREQAVPHRLERLTGRPEPPEDVCTLEEWVA